MADPNKLPFVTIMEVDNLLLVEESSLPREHAIHLTMIVGWAVYLWPCLFGFRTRGILFPPVDDHFKRPYAVNS